ncbi:receptor-mediated endocytosis protein 6 homolog [Stomoxys calcitrans]|uniref:Receptor-mediated endocytosis protein 6 homolog n=1 Tax=Stomoxys calcitrans TaxID=35570 RepID=A0A1I8Q506_STOCA|nr:receptor-mediated endocytosis protein 6 homolog [Stomoxys calcitrans]XP_013104600.1 receptor-mediated endocytosis protein 6 homolog [Stomoxys calcitrans]XP_013104601.1 receptor-mediated endocytosis protein 6 homolog [Stomoxys calcitrans]
MESNTEGNLLEIMDLARTLRQEQLFIQQEQATFVQLTETLSENSASITKLAYICAQQRRNLNDLIVSRPELGPSLCCRRAKNYGNSNFVDSKKVLNYEHAIAYEELFNYLYKSPYILAVSLATGDSISEISPAHMNSVIQTISTGLFGNAINSKDVEMILKLLRELIEIQIVTSDNPRRLLRANASSFSRIYHRLNESMFSAKIFLTAALFQPIMSVLTETDTILDVDPQKVIQRFSTKERIRRFGPEDSAAYADNVDKFHAETIGKLHSLAKTFIDSLLCNWSLFPSTLRWLVQTMCHQLKQSHNFSERIMNEIITDMVFTHFICPAIVSPDALGIIDAPISEQVRFNLMQIGQIVQMLALIKHDDIDPRYAEVYRKFESNTVTRLIDLLLVTQTGEDVVAILAQQSDFDRAQLMATQRELSYFAEFFRILTAAEEYAIPEEDKEKLKKIMKNLPESQGHRHQNGEAQQAGAATESPFKEKSKPSLISKATKTKLAKTMSFAHNGGSSHNAEAVNGLLNGNHVPKSNGLEANRSNHNSNHSSPTRSVAPEIVDNEPILIFTLYNRSDQKLQPLSEEEVLKMNSIGQDINNSDLVDTENYQQESTVDKSSVVNGFDGIDGMSDVLRPLHNKTARFSLSHDDASIVNSDNLEAVSEVPSNHSVTSSLELEENVENDNLSDMVSANVSGRGTPNISGRDTPSSQVTDGESLNNALPTPQMQKLISKARSDIEDKFCKFEIKKFEGDETVSIISDTWSTDVLASDSETVDAVERERERNFSTPLIPAAVILPGDNNFDVRAGYLDASDQRSESNWSTDVLASDSEKLNEVDTDDNISITARSDTQVSVRSERERDQLAAAISSGPMNRHGRSSIPSQFPPTVRRNVRAFRPLAASHGIGPAKPPSTGSVDDVNVSGGSSGGNASDRSQEDSAFYDAINSYDDNSNQMANNPNLHHYRDGSSLARSSVRTTNHMGAAEDSFQQNYKSIANEGDKDTFLSPSTSSAAAAHMHRNRMRRQTSAESSISNQSLSLEEQATGAAKLPQAPAMSSSSSRKKRHQSNISNESKDLIDFSDFVDDKDLTPPSMAPPDPPLLEGLPDDGLVERRNTSTLQRNAGDDGRRNGIMALKGGRESSERGSNSTPYLRRHQSLNYENHEIVLNTVPSRVSAMPNLSPPSDEKPSSQQQEQRHAYELLLLCGKTSEMNLQDNDLTDNVNEAARNTPTNIVVSSSSIMMPSTSSSKPNKSTGAIPKSISFDASADKTHGPSTSSASTSARQQRSAIGRLPDATSLRTIGTPNINSNSSIFNKLKQGIFKHRRGHKSRHLTSNSEDISQCSRSVSFSNNTSEVSLDLLGANLPGTSSSAAQGSGVGYYDISEDILAKYRRKVSTSSEATNSSIGNGIAGAMGGGIANDVLGKEDMSNNQHPSMHDKTLTFNIIKKKIRTVLSKTDLHSGDFRHTTHANISPLLTYLQIQLAQAINLQNFQQISYVSEAIRCISTLDVAQHTQIMAELQNDMQKRQNYLQYLMRYRQNLLMVMENIEQFESRLHSESLTCNRYLMAVCMRIFFDKRQDRLSTFQEDFARLTVSDDKVDLIEEFLDSLIEELVAPGGILYGMPEWQVIESRLSLERILLQNMYQQVMFPNEDADLSRDSVLSEHIRKLQNVITPSHPALRIPQMYLSEAPWSFAQQQLKFISAYKTPREKLQCVERCISSIINLLHMSSARVPATDDLLPVLIYVVIMANPPYLLSTVEYISCFIGSKLDGEEHFHWTLFDSVVKFIKTMDYSEH